MGSNPLPEHSHDGRKAVFPLPPNPSPRPTYRIANGGRPVTLDEIEILGTHCLFFLDGLLIGYATELSFYDKWKQRGPPGADHPLGELVSYRVGQKSSVAGLGHSLAISSELL